MAETIRCRRAAIVAFICIFLAAATLYAYWDVQSFEFVLFDDPLYILDNRVVKEGLTAQGLSLGLLRRSVRQTGTP